MELRVCVNKMRLEFRILSNKTNCVYCGCSPKSHDHNNTPLLLLKKSILSKYSYIRYKKSFIAVYIFVIQNANYNFEVDQKQMRN